MEKGVPPRPVPPPESRSALLTLSPRSNPLAFAVTAAVRTRPGTVCTCAGRFEVDSAIWTTPPVLPMAPGFIGPPGGTGKRPLRLGTLKVVLPSPAPHVVPHTANRG